MLDEFWESLGEDLAKRWVEHLFGPAGLFWLGGVLLLALEQRVGEQAVAAWLNLSAWVQGALAVIAIAGVVGSALLMRLFVFPLLRVLEGYWWRPLRMWVTRRLAKRWQKRYERARALKKRESEALTEAEQLELIELEGWLHQYPRRVVDLMPTGLGNLLRARELGPRDRYGLDAVVCWARLWGLLPGDLREDLMQARAALNRRVEAFGWGVLFLLWGCISLWAIPVGVVWMLIAYAQAVRAAGPYGELVETAFDLYRWRLYDVLGWQRPADSASEKTCGEALSEFLWRGTLKEPKRYLTPHPPQEG